MVRSISESQGKMDGLIAAAGIQQETSALDYSQKDAIMMFEVSFYFQHLCEAWITERERERKNRALLTFVLIVR